MTRSTAREIAMHLAYQLSFTELPVEEFLDQQLSAERFAELAAEDELYADMPNAKQEEYIRRLVSGVAEHAAEHLRQHAGRELIVGDDAVLQRVHGDDIAGRAPEHAPRCRPDLQHLAAVFIEGDDGRLAQHDAAPGRIDQHVGRAEIDPKVSGKE